MDSLKPALRRTVEVKDLVQFGKFVAYKLAITLLSYQSLKALRAEFSDLIYAAPFNSFLTQIVEFTVMRLGVFNGRKRSHELTRRQFARFWVVVIGLGIGEGFVMRHLIGEGWGFRNAYIVGHIPFLFTRFFLDRNWVYRE